MTVEHAGSLYARQQLDSFKIISHHAPGGILQEEKLLTYGAETEAPFGRSCPKRKQPKRKRQDTAECGHDPG